MSTLVVVDNSKEWPLQIPGVALVSARAYLTDPAYGESHSVKVFNLCKSAAVEAARRIEMQISRGMNEAQQLATAPFLHTSVTEANRTYEGKDANSIQRMIKDWQQRWRERDKQIEFPLFINRIVTNYLIRWHDIRKTDYVGILVTDQQGALVVSSIPQVEYFYGKTPWWQAVVKGGSLKGYVGEIAFDPGFGTHVIVVAAPILDDTKGTVIGAVTILLRRDTIFHAIGEVTIGATGHAMLFSSEGVPVICPVLPPEAHTVRPETISALVGAQAGWTVAVDDSHGSKDALIGFAPVRFGETLAPGSLGGHQWVTVVRQDPKETYAPLAELVAKVLLYGLLVLAVLWGTGIIVARRIARPIQLLHDGVREIGSGRLDQRLELKTGDEIEGLADAFNQMATNLQRSFGQIEQRVVDVRSLEEKYRDLIEHSPEVSGSDSESPTPYPQAPRDTTRLTRSFFSHSSVILTDNHVSELAKGRSIWGATCDFP